ncbi:ribosome hibernation-promoting factor, HPF/YfiA family [Cryptosporangium aurantiacum]|uniref:Ribosome hibernation promoting factor n=1 Tax=Cryptosporangium aurantiacum TaxID=134849 RepID=A0A1M7RNA2_9ACTN|nr:ribosome-associated translation inhibitor RaiA [Cryptosporangium aurantiacum]SHN47817.1 ribosomal subunit interface protein [Cryptosporangium aurantiacum]
MDIVVKGRNVEVPDHYRQNVSEKLSRVERYDQKLIRIDVELFHEPNRRQAQTCQRVEITVKTRGPVIRSEAAAADFYSALDLAITKLENRLRRAADRRRVHHGRRTPVSVASAMAEATAELPAPMWALPNGSEPTLEEHGSVAVLDEWEDGPCRIVRTKEHPGEPMTVDDALFEMELVGHDFYLFNDKDTGRPSVVYRRKGYDYGVICLGI